MDLIKAIKEHVEAVSLAFKVKEPEEESAKTKPKLTKEEKEREKRENQRVKLVRFTYDRDKDEYVWDENTHVMRKDLPDGCVHMTGRKNTYVLTDIWDELIWPGTGQSAIHMYLWMINTKINPESIADKGKAASDIDMKKVLMYAAIGIVILIVSWQFIPKG